MKTTPSDIALRIYNKIYPVLYDETIYDVACFCAYFIFDSVFDGGLENDKIKHLAEQLIDELEMYYSYEKGIDSTGFHQKAPQDN